MSKVIRRCVMCSKEYEHCSNCGSAPQLWKNIFCSENCRDIYDVLNKYDGNLISKEDGTKQLKKFDLKVVSKFNDRFKKLAEELTPKKEAPKPKKKTENKPTETAPKKRTTKTRSRKTEED